MSYNVLAINPGHNGSICFLKDGKIELYIEEERLTRQKYDGNPLRGIIHVLQNNKIDALVLGGTGDHMYPKLTWNGEDTFTSTVRRFCPDVKVFNLSDQHHFGHAACAFYNSGFDEAAAVIVDGSGSVHSTGIKSYFDTSGSEIESIYDCSYEKDMAIVYKSYGANFGATTYNDTKSVKITSGVGITKAYESVTTYVGFHPIEAGKTMGLSSYGGPNDQIPDMFIGNNSNKHLFAANYPSGGFIDVENYPQFKLKSMADGDLSIDLNEVAKDEDDLKFVQDLAWKLQQETQKQVGDLIEKAVQITGKKNVVIAGGFGLNCVANYYYKKRFPDINIYVDPVSHDGGTAIGLAKALWYSYCTENDKKAIKEPLKTLYLGIDRNSEVDVTPHLNEFDITEVTPDDVAKLIADQNIVCLFNGAAEAGPRALGNRSILFDPRTKDGKDIVNKVKGREWFRPFAGSILKEHVHEWFDMAGMDESPFMMYAVDVLPERIGQVTSITHVDNTCRIQTVTKEQNEHYYNLIDSFKKLTGVPILFNTSFNLAGEPLVETFDDAIRTLLNSKMNYLYVPSKGILLKKKQ